MNFYCIFEYMLCVCVSERDGHVDYKQFCSPEGRRSFRNVHNDALGFQHRAQPLRYFGPRGRFQYGIDDGSVNVL